MPKPNCLAAQFKAVALFLETRTSDAFAPLCEILTPRLLRYFLIRGVDPDVAEELTQDVLFTTYRQSHNIRDRRLFEAWIFKVARNAMLQRVRQANRRIATVSFADLSAAIDRLASPDNQFVRIELSGLLDSLNPQDREIITLRFVDGLQYEEIAAVLDIPQGTAKWRVFNVRAKLADRMAARARVPATRENRVEFAGAQV